MLFYVKDPETGWLYPFTACDARNAAIDWCRENGWQLCASCLATHDLIVEEGCTDIKHLFSVIELV